MSFDGVQRRRFDVIADNHLCTVIGVEFVGDIPGLFEQFLLSIHSFFLEFDVLFERRLPWNLDDVGSGEFGIAVLVGVSARRCEP